MEGNSAFGYEAAPVAVRQVAEAKPGAAVCKRCGHEGTCTCPTILADAIERWTGADIQTATRIAAQVWGETQRFRLGEQHITYVPLARECTFCGAAVRKTDDGQLVATTVSPNVDPVDDPVCPDSPTRTHALP